MNHEIMLGCAEQRALTAIQDLLVYSHRSWRLHSAIFISIDSSMARKSSLILSIVIDLNPTKS
jgi:hypothetical protein